MKRTEFQPLDIVKTPKGGMAIIKEISGGSASIRYFLDCNPKNEHDAWWGKNDGLVVVDSLPRILANCMVNPMGDAKDQGSKFFPVEYPSTVNYLAMKAVKLEE